MKAKIAIILIFLLIQTSAANVLEDSLNSIQGNLSQLQNDTKIMNERMERFSKELPEDTRAQIKDEFTHNRLMAFFGIIFVATFGAFASWTFSYKTRKRQMNDIDRTLKTFKEAKKEIKALKQEMAATGREIQKHKRDMAQTLKELKKTKIEGATGKRRKWWRFWK